MRNRLHRALIGAGCTLAAAFFAFGCTATSGSSATTQETGTKGAAQLWQENCHRCHNFRSPKEFSDAQWDVIVMHMRVRANLTAREHEAIVGFLKAGN